MPRVLFIQYTNPGAYPPLVQAAHLLAEAGADVRILGVRMADTLALRVPPHPRISVRYLPAPGRGLRQRAHYVAYAVWALATAIRWRADWIYVSDMLATPFAVLLGWLSRVSVAYHEHDVPLAERPSRFGRLCLATRRLVARRATIAVVPNAERARLLASATGRRGEVLTVWNCPRRADMRSRRSNRGRLTLIYQGSVVADRLPVTVVEAVAATPDAELVVVGYEVDGARGYVDELRRTAAHLGVADRVRFEAATDRQALLDVTVHCDVGLSLMPLESSDASMRMMVGASNKAFEYLACGLPALVSDIPSWRATFVDPGYALACDPRDAGSIARALRWCVEHRADVATMGERGRGRVADDWNYETQFAPVRDAIVGAVTPASARGENGLAEPLDVAGRAHAGSRA